MNWLTERPQRALWVGRSAYTAGALLWAAYTVSWVYLDIHSPHAPDAGHTFAYEGHRGSFYLSGDAFLLLNAVTIAAIVLFIGGNWIARRAARRPQTHWRLP